MSNLNNNLSLIILSGILAMVFSFWKTSWITKQSQGNDRMKSIGSSIADGAMAFLRAEYRILGVFVIAVAFILGFANTGPGDSSLIISIVTNISGNKRNKKVRETKRSNTFLKKKKYILFFYIF